MSAGSVVILSGSALCNNPRVIKEAIALAEVGCEVEVLGAWLDSAQRERDKELLPGLPFRFTPVVDVLDSSVTTKIQWLVARCRRKAGQLAFSISRAQSQWQLGVVVGALNHEARRRRADLFIAHSEPAMAAACGLLKSGRRVGLDMEDWFSEDLLPAARLHRPLRLLRNLERQLLRQEAHSSCPSRAMSEALAQEYECSPPRVVYNAFPWSDRRSIDTRPKDRADHQIPSIHWYSQTLGEGRGLEDLLAALKFVDHPAEIHLRGTPARGFDCWLAERVPHKWRDRVFVHQTVSNSELLSRIAEHDIGFAGEMKYCRNKDLTVSNKLLHYLLAGLAVVASDTLGQQEIAAQAPGAVLLYRSGDVEMLASRLSALLGSSEHLNSAKVSALQAAEKTLCWEQQKGSLQTSIMLALKS